MPETVLEIDSVVLIWLGGFDFETFLNFWLIVSAYAVFDLSVNIKLMQLALGETVSKWYCMTANHLEANFAALKLAIPEVALQDFVETCAVISREKTAKTMMKIAIDLKGFFYNFIL